MPCSCCAEGARKKKEPPLSHLEALGREAEPADGVEHLVVQGRVERDALGAALRARRPRALLDVVPHGRELVGRRLARPEAVLGLFVFVGGREK